MPCEFIFKMKQKSCIPIGITVCYEEYSKIFFLGCSSCKQPFVICGILRVSADFHEGFFHAMGVCSEFGTQLFGNGHEVFELIVVLTGGHVWPLFEGK